MDNCISSSCVTGMTVRWKPFGGPHSFKGIVLGPKGVIRAEAGRVWGENINLEGSGGLWHAEDPEGNRLGDAYGYKTIFDAQAAVEVAHYEEQSEEVDEADKDTVCEALNGIIASSFEQLVGRTSLNDGMLSDVIAALLEEGRIRIKFDRRTGKAFYLLHT